MTLGLELLWEIMADPDLETGPGALLRMSQMTVSEASRFLSRSVFRVQAALDRQAELDTDSLARLIDLSRLMDTRVLETAQSMINFENQSKEPRAVYPDIYTWPNKSTRTLYFAQLQNHMEMRRLRLNKTDNQTESALPYFRMQQRLVS